MWGAGSAHVVCAEIFTSVNFFSLFIYLYVYFFNFLFARYGLLFYVTSMCCGSERPGDVEPHFFLFFTSRFPKRKEKKQNRFFLIHSYILYLSFAFYEPSPFTTHRSPRCVIHFFYHSSMSAFSYPEGFCLGISEL